MHSRKSNSAAANKKRCDERNNKGKVQVEKKSSKEPKLATTVLGEPEIVTDTEAKSAPAEQLSSVANHHAGFHQPSNEIKGTNNATDAASDDEWVMLDDDGQEVMPYVGY